MKFLMYLLSFLYIVKSFSYTSPVRAVVQGTLRASIATFYLLVWYVEGVYA